MTTKKFDLSEMTFGDKVQLHQALKEELGFASRFDTDEFMEMSIMWAQGKITVTVIRDMIGNNNYAQCVAVGLRRAIRNGRLVEMNQNGMDQNKQS